MQIDQKNLELYTRKSLREKGLFRFDKQKILESIKKNDGREGFAIRISGSHLEIHPWVIRAGKVKLVDELKGYKASSFNGSMKHKFLDELEKISEIKGNLYIGISAAGLVDGTKNFSPNLHSFQIQFEKEYESDFAYMFSGKKVRVVNDAKATMVVVLMNSLKPEYSKSNIVLQVLGTGAGGCVYIAEGDYQGEIFTIEPGHLPAQSLNIFNETEKSVLCKSEVPIEKVIAGPAITRAWERRFHETIKAEDIHNIAVSEEGEKQKFAKKIIDNIALGLAQTYIGISQTYSLNPSDTLLVCQGGVWKIPKLKDKVKKIVYEKVQIYPEVIYDEKYLDNCDILGAAFVGASNK